jgi:mRNA-degrading endonuclease RelE of RelBE toxin-antitoxin system
MGMDKDKKLQTVVETPEFIKEAERCMEGETRKEFVDYIALNPMEGRIMRGTGGARKIRWSSNKNQGKRGGVRVVYYYHDEDLPVFLFTVYGKSVKENLSKTECNALQSIIKQIIANYED